MIDKIDGYLEHTTIILKLHLMSLSPFVLVTLAVCWIVPAVFIAVRYGLDRYRAAAETVDLPAQRDMDHTQKSMRVELSSRHGATRGNKWGVLHAGSYSDVVESQTSESVREVVLSAPYAEASVRVTDSAGDPVLRRCSICMN